MSIAEKSIIIVENVPKVYQAGYEKGKADGGGEGDYEQGYNDGYAKAESENPFYNYANSINGMFQKVKFPENYNLVVKMKKPFAIYQTFTNAENLKSITLIADETVESIQMYQSFYFCQSVEEIDLTQWCTSFHYFIYVFGYCTKLRKILGAMDLSRVTEIGTTSFAQCSSLEDIEFVPNTIPLSINFSGSDKLTAKSIQSIFDGLATVETAQTLTLHTNVKILQSQVDSANAKGWTVAGGTVVSEEEYYG